MNIITGDQNTREGIWPEKVYTQQEVDVMLESGEGSIPSRARQIEEEGQIADKRKRLENTIVEGLVKKSNRVLVSISSHAFPFDFFPNTINVEEGRVTVIKRHFLSSEVHSVDIMNISNVFINTSFIFSQLVIISRTYEENEIRVRSLRTNEAMFVRGIIEGLRVFKNNNIDTSSYTKRELVSKLQELRTRGEG